jgi:hypothetical protein
MNGFRLWRKAKALDVEIPSSTEQDMWTYTDDREQRFLSVKGRARVRRIVHEEQSRQFDIRYAYFTKIVIPFLGLVAGTIGAVTGLIAVLHSHK